MFSELKNLLEKWYPLAVDEEYGGYFTNITHDFQLRDEHEKMLVTQARHVWATAKAAEFLASKEFLAYSRHGADFLEAHMWDKEFGGYYQMRSREGGICDAEGFYDEKRTYGNAFALYGLSALYGVSGNVDYLDRAIRTFNWIEQRAFDRVHKGYFQFLQRKGEVFGKEGEYKTKAFDAVEAGYKDQNSSIHLLEAYTELYRTWKNVDMHSQLEGLLCLVRDTIVHPKGYLQLFFEEDWTPVSFRNKPLEEREQNYRLDHVSFGHDYETAFLMLEASFELGLVEDYKTLKTAKALMDHAIENGWDKKKGGFFEEGYYPDIDGPCEIIKDTKNWWAQAEGLNALLIFSLIFTEEKRYKELFFQLWEYVKKYIIDQKHGGWYWGGIDKQPEMKKADKGSIWKGTYHNSRALINCVAMISERNDDIITGNTGIRKVAKEKREFIQHWQQTVEQMPEDLK